MGAVEFSTVQSGTSVKDAFADARAETTHEHGHGGYSGTIAEKGNYQVLLNHPIPEHLGSIVADSLSDRVADKHGPAGALPLLRRTRTVTVDVAAGPLDNAALTTQITDDLKKRRVLKRGESVKSVRLFSYTTPDRPRYGANAYSRLGPATTFTNGRAEVTIEKAPTLAGRRLELTMQADPTLDYDTMRKTALEHARTHARLRAGEQVLAVRVSNIGKTTTKVTVQAPKGKTVTRYVVEGDRQHGTWATGFASQAEARAYVTAAAKAPVSGHQAHFGGTLDVVAVTKRDNGDPLVRATITPVKADVTITVAVINPAEAAKEQPDAWLFFGMASY